MILTTFLSTGVFSVQTSLYNYGTITIEGGMLHLASTSVLEGQLIFPNKCEIDLEGGKHVLREANIQCKSGTLTVSGSFCCLHVLSLEIDNRQIF